VLTETGTVDANTVSSWTNYAYDPVGRLASTSLAGVSGSRPAVSYWTAPACPEAGFVCSAGRS